MNGEIVLRVADRVIKRWRNEEKNMKISNIEFELPLFYNKRTQFNLIMQKLQFN